MRPWSAVDDCPSTVKDVNEQRHKSLPCMSAWRAKGYLVLRYSGNSTVQPVNSLISITTRSDVSCKSQTHILSGRYVFNLLWFTLLSGQ
jgi:hypothetical protein